jgi:class 3 adenylate cyclase/tetratricopeptide (TPR) repeat protein
VQCRHENPADHKFCGQCGAALALTCPGCGRGNDPDHLFCGGCGQSLAEPPTAEAAAVSALGGGGGPAPQPSPPAGERRQATVLFSDLCGYTAMNERLDPEEVEGIMSRVKAEAVRIVEEHGGIVNQFVGDEVLALFGIPTAHGDDPRRAVRAALEMHKVAHQVSPEVEERIGRPLRMHTGIDTGLIVTSLRDVRNGTYGITGDTVNTGARLKALAADDEILVSPNTQGVVARYFEMALLPTAKLKGKGRPFAPYRVTGDLRGGAEGRQAFIGRQAELRQFGGLVEACLETGRGQTVYLRGEAGIGKTRLVEECRALAEGSGFACHTGLTLDFGIGKGRDAIRAVVRSLLGIAPGSGKDVRRAAAEKAIAEGLLQAEREPYLNDLLDYRQPPEWRAIYDAMDNEARNRGKRETVAELVGAASGKGPLMVVIEDLHWAERIALLHLAALTAVMAEVPALLVMTSRIEGDPVDAAWRAATGGSPLLTLDLAPLRKEEALSLAGEFVDATSRFATNCIARAEGNPLFLEQLLRSAEETADEAVPGSVQSIVLARMDRLEPPDKQALQAASILGQHFALEPLRHLVESPAYSCEALISHYLVRPEGGDYLFCHALIQEGVYSSLLKARRRELHRRAAGWFAGHDLVLRAEHLERAEDAAAPGAYLEAAQDQAAEFHYERALQMAERGLGLARDKGKTFALTLFRGQILHDLGSIPESIAAYEQALAAAADDVERCRAWIGLAAGMRITDQYDEALKALDKAEAAAAANGLTHELAQLHHLRGNIYFPLGNLDGCLEQHELALQEAQKAGSREYEARALGGLGDAHYLRGRMRTANGHFRRCVDLCREHGFGRVEVANRHMCGWSGMYLNELEQAVEDGLETVELAGKVSHPRAENLALGLVFFVLGEFFGEAAKSLEYSERALAFARNLKATRFEAHWMIDAGKAELHQGKRSSGLKLAKQALKICRETGMHFIGPRALGAIAMITDDPRERQEALREAEQILAEGCVGHNYFWFYRDAMQVCLDGGEWDEVERYAAALEDYARPEPLPWSDFFIARGRALAAHGRGERGEALMAQLQQLRDEAKRVGFRTDLPAIEQALAES